MRSMTERPVRGFEPSASTISGARSMRSWLFEMISTMFLCGDAASFAIVSSSVAGLSATISSRLGSPECCSAKNDSSAG